VFSKHPRAYHHLKKQLFNRTVDRFYTAVIEGVPTPRNGRIQTYLKELPTGIVVRTDDPKAGQLAVTDYELLGKVRLPKAKGAKKRPLGKDGKPRPPGPDDPPTHLSLLRIKLRTGRKHQIRAHAQWLGHSLVGDKIYGPDARLYLDFIDHGWTELLAARLLLPRQALHCAEIDLRPAGLSRVFSAPMPADLAQFLNVRGIAV
jgi:23S rRNA pseudouridine1911/1915/1917 synthase